MSADNFVDYSQILMCTYFSVIHAGQGQLDVVCWRGMIDGSHLI